MRLSQFATAFPLYPGLKNGEVPTLNSAEQAGNEINLQKPGPQVDRTTAAARERDEFRMTVAQAEKRPRRQENLRVKSPLQLCQNREKMYEEKDAIIKYDDGRCDKATKGDKLVVEERRDAADVRSG